MWDVGWDWELGFGIWDGMGWDSKWVASIAEQVTYLLSNLLLTFFFEKEF